MRQHLWFFFVLELFVAAACLYLGVGEQSLNALVVCALICACLLTTRLLLEIIKASEWLTWLCALLCAATLFVYGAGILLPFVVVSLCDILGKRVGPSSAFALTFAVAVLLALIFPQRAVSLLGAVAGGVLALSGVMLAHPLARIQMELADKDKRIDALQTRLADQRDAIGAIERQTRQAERNRLAARIHDRVGHGITGSILMLEAAQLQWDADAPSARASIEKATENLRESVDEIRRELRSERSVDEQVSLIRITAELDAFSDEHPGIACELETAGPLDALPQAIWSCIYESLRETLANLLRHSNADHFHALISHRNLLVYVEFADNGSTAAGEETGLTERGIGLVAIQERALLAGGRAFFSLTPWGFTTKLTFPLRG
jgi:signal transduction histidine kinase